MHTASWHCCGEGVCIGQRGMGGVERAQCGLSGMVGKVGVGVVCVSLFRVVRGGLDGDGVTGGGGGGREDWGVSGVGGGMRDALFVLRAGDV